VLSTHLDRLTNEVYSLKDKVNAWPKRLGQRSSNNPFSVEEPTDPVDTSMRKEAIDTMNTSLSAFQQGFSEI